MLDEADTQAVRAPLGAMIAAPRSLGIGVAPENVSAIPAPAHDGRARGTPARRIDRYRSLIPGAIRIGAVVVPVGVVLLGTSALGIGTLVAASIAAMLWVTALRRSYANAQVSLMVQGVGFATAIGVMTGLAAVSLLGFWLPGIDPNTDQILLMTAGVFITSASLESFAERFEPRRRVLIVRTSNSGAYVSSDLAKHPRLPFECVGIVGLPQLANVVEQTRPELVVLGSGPGRAEALRQLLDVVTTDCRIVGIDQFYEHAFGRVPAEHLSPIWFMSVLHLYERPQSRVAKRIFDLALASLGLAIAAPVLLILALLVRRSGPGPIIYRQVRLGEGGKTFEILKLRTMVDGAEQDGNPVWATNNDPRETRVGRFMRSTRLDELPQLWNVLRGEMSLVGPRPERPEFVSVLQREVPFWTSRHLVKPGITGWAQVRLGYTSDNRGAAEKLSYDLYYLRHRSVLFDLAITIKTARIVALGVAGHRHRETFQTDQPPI